MPPTSNILMIRPAAFAYNSQTAVNNAFQQYAAGEHIQEKALQEFDNFASALTAQGIDVTIVEDTPFPHTPDSIFPNNWVSFHEDGTIVLYPMFAENRRAERKKNVLQTINEKFFIRSTFDFTGYEIEDIFLEGTGSMVLDRDNGIAYACLSPRTHPTPIYDFCESLGYTPVLFNAVGAGNKAIYHTNVMMCVAEQYVVICMDSIANETQQKMLRKKFEDTGKAVVEISFDQVNQFAGNMLELQNRDEESMLVMSTQAYKSLSDQQIETLTQYSNIIHSPLYTIEQNGGGSARCMIAEIFLPKIV